MPTHFFPFSDSNEQTGEHDICCVQMSPYLAVLSNRKGISCRGSLSQCPPSRASMHVYLGTHLSSVLQFVYSENIDKEHDSLVTHSAVAFFGAFQISMQRVFFQLSRKGTTLSWWSRGMSLQSCYDFCGSRKNPGTVGTYSTWRRQ